MSYYIEKLKDPHLVWEFQYYFGIRRLPPNSKGTGVTTTNCNGTTVNVVNYEGQNDSKVTQKHSQNQSNGGIEHANHHSTWNGSGCISSTAFITQNGHAKGMNGFVKTVQDPLLLKQRTVSVASRRSAATADGGRGDSPNCNEDTWSSSGTSDSDSGSGSGSAQSGENGSGSQEGSSSATDVDYVITRPFWYYLFSFGAALGDETFYSSFFPFWFWNVDGAVCRRVVMIWVLIMYIGQGLKDVVRWPRPSSPPVIRLEEKWALEYGMPSTHAMVGAAVPFSFLFYTMYRYEYPVILGVIVCSIWCCLVCGSRLYLGMHTVLDIIVGIVLVVILMIILIPFIDIIDYFTLTSTYSPPCILSAYILMIICYPDADHWTPARGDTVVILGVGAGIAIGSWLNYQWGIISGPPMPPPYQILWPTYEMVGLTMLRTCIGILVVVATRAFYKSITYALACYFLKLDPRDKENWRKMAVELTSKFLTYSAIAFNVTYLSPAVFRFMNIERATMFTEV